MKTLLLLAYLFSLAAFPAPPDARQVGCKVAFVEDLGLDDTTPLDISARDVFKRVEGRHDLTLHWHDGRAEHAHLTLEYRGGRIEYVKRAFDDAGTGQEIALPCDNRLEMAVVLSFETEETGLKIQLPTTLKSSARDQVLLRVELSPTVLSNAELAAISEHGRRLPEPAWLVFEAQFTNAGFQGALNLLSTESELAESLGVSVNLVKERLARWVVGKRTLTSAER